MESEGNRNKLGLAEGLLEVAMLMGLVGQHFGLARNKVLLWRVALKFALARGMLD